MNLKILILLSALLMLCVRPSSAQPTCSSLFNAFETCSREYRDSEYVFFGQVVDVQKIPSPVSGYNKWQRVIVVVEASIKGQLGPRVTLTLDGSCYGYVSTNGKYMFTADRHTFTLEGGGEEAGLLTRKWSRAFAETSPVKMARLVNEIREFLQGVPQPRLFGTVTDLGAKPRLSLSGPGDRLPQPLSGVVVVAENKEGKQTRTRTNADGDYEFDRLPVGTYSVYPILPQMDLYANTTLLQQGGKQPVQIDNRLCGATVSFAGQLTGNVTVRVERETGDWKSSLELDLYRVELTQEELKTAGWRNFSQEEIRPSYLKPETAAGTKFEIGFDRVPVGSYVLSYTAGPDFASLFYPAALYYQNAKLIKVEVGKRTDIAIKIPFFQIRRIFGRITLPGGTPVAATIQLIDESEPNSRLGEMTTPPNGQFEFRIWLRRPSSLYAYYIGKQDGKVVRFFTRTKRMILEHDLGPVTITLDHIEPY